MAWDDLKENILTVAREESDAVSARWREKLKSEEARIQQQARAIEEQIIDEAHRQGQQQAQRRRQEHQLSAKAHVLEVKQRELEQTAKEAYAAILAWDETEATRWLAGLIKSLPSRDGKIIPGSHHRGMVASLLEGKKYVISREGMPDEGGFRWQGASAEVDFTLHRLVAARFERRRAEIARQLFA